MPPTRATFAIAGQAAEEKIGKFGYFSGTFAAVLEFCRNKGLSKQNIISIDHDGTNYFVFYWK